MKLDLPEIEIQRSKSFQQTTFEIGDPRVIFNILRSKMYSRPIRAICQEIMSNARDANREVGRGDVPIEVTISSLNGHMLYIKDNGPGIDPERMATVYTRYGSSTKRGDNLQTGGFGLGAKTPFAYVDSFQVITITADGKKRIYLAFIDETQKGAVTLLSESDSTEPTGTTIAIPLKEEQDKKLFWVECHEVSNYWDVKPIILDDMGMEHKGPTVAVSYPFGCVLKHTWNHRTAIITIDGIPYDLRKDSFKTPLINNDRMVAHFGVGELPVTANREDIDYQPGVVEKITERFQAIADEYLKDYYEAIQNAPNILVATRNYNENAELLRTFGYKKMTWRGKKMLPGTLELHEIKSEQLLDANGKPVVDAEGNEQYEFNGRTDIKVRLWYLDHKHNVEMKKSWNAPITMFYPLESEVYVTTEEEPDRRRIHTAIQNTNLPVVTILVRKGLAWLDKEFDFSSWVNRKLEDVEPYVVKRKSTSGYKISKVKFFDLVEGWKPSEKTTDDPEGGIYVVIHRGQVYPRGNKNKTMSQQQLKQTSRLFNIHIYGLQSKWFNGVDTAWVTLHDYLVKQYLTMRYSDEFAEYIAAGTDDVKVLESSIDDPNLKAWAKFMHTNYRDIHRLEWVADYLGRELPKPAQGLTKWFRRHCQQRFPMLLLYSFSPDEARDRAIQDYVRRQSEQD